MTLVIGIDDEGMEIIFDSLKKNNSLIHLGIGFCLFLLTQKILNVGQHCILILMLISSKVSFREGTQETLGMRFDQSKFGINSLRPTFRISIQQCEA
jgi:hypothetical protein